VINYHSDGDTAAELVGRIKADGGRAISLEADVSIEQDVKRLFEKTVAAFGHVDVLVTNSGVLQDA